MNEKKILSSVTNYKIVLIILCMHSMLINDKTYKLEQLKLKLMFYYSSGIVLTLQIIIKAST